MTVKLARERGGSPEDAGDGAQAVASASGEHPIPHSTSLSHVRVLWTHRHHDDNEEALLKSANSSGAFVSQPGAKR